MAQLVRVVIAFLFVLVGFAAWGCGGKSTGYLPVDSPIIEFEPPDREDLIEEDDMEEEDEDESSAEGRKGDNDGAPRKGGTKGPK